MIALSIGAAPSVYSKLYILELTIGVVHFRVNKTSSGTETCRPSEKAPHNPTPPPPPRPPGRARPGAGRGGHLRAAATQAFARTGFAATSLDDIAEQAGISR